MTEITNFVRKFAQNPGRRIAQLTPNGFGHVPSHTLYRKMPLRKLLIAYATAKKGVDLYSRSEEQSKSTPYGAQGSWTEAAGDMQAAKINLLKSCPVNWCALPPSAG